MEGGDDNPSAAGFRDIIGKKPMFNYPSKQTPDPDADPNNNGVPLDSFEAPV